MNKELWKRQISLNIKKKNTFFADSEKNKIETIDENLQQSFL